MDLIIELIIWMFKAISGEQDKNRPAGKRGPAAPSVKRGPYNYGDGRADGSKPRTLEEILEDVKRQQTQGKAGGQKPKAQRVSDAPLVPEKVKIPTLSRPLSEIQLPSDVRASAVQPMGGAKQSKLETRMLTQSLDQREVVRPGLERKFDKLSERESQQSANIGRTKMVAEVNTVTTMGEVQTVDAMGMSLSDKKTNSFSDAFIALRTASPKARAEMARRAFVYAEVFGPPRCRKMHRR